ncbi:MAG: hypothetical protein M5U27_16805 [Gaiella sp.]|nr:hypothetical protein [Gaiella sp.]
MAGEIVVAGATGGLGSRIAAKLAGRGVVVRALVRTATTGAAVGRLESAGIEIRRVVVAALATLGGLEERLRGHVRWAAAATRAAASSRSS